MEPIRSQFRYFLPAPPERVWPILADTEGVNRVIGLPVTEPRAIPGETVRMARVRARKGWLRLEWEEEPFDFVEGDYFWVRRRIAKGPIRAFNGGARFVRTDGGTEVQVESEFLPANAVGQALIRLLVSRVKRDWDRLADRVRAHLEEDAERPYAYDRSPPAVQEKTRRLLDAADSPLWSSPIGARLREFMITASDRELLRIRPFVLARDWGVERYEVLRLFLRAAHAGILDLSWDVLCPNCRGAPARLGRLEEVPPEMHCGDCQITFDANFDQAVEVTFRPNGRYRTLDAGVYCSGGPLNTPHIVAQQLLAPGARSDLEVTLGPGRYRLRNLAGSMAEWIYAVQTESASVLQAVFDDSTVSLSPADGRVASGRISVSLLNEGPERQQAILERVASYEDCLTAATVSVYQEFRTLFSSEVLSPNAQLSIRTLPLLFTDLKGSTLLYGELGDASAYALVRDHFALLREVVARHHGGVVKTVGDAVMAAFPNAADAFACALDIHRDLEQFNRSARSPLRLKIGLHQGPCIAVRGDDDRLDYFGSTVNLAARVHGESLGDDIVLTHAMTDDHSVAELLAPLRSSPFTAALRGVGETKLTRVYVPDTAMDQASSQAAEAAGSGPDGQPSRG